MAKNKTPPTAAKEDKQADKPAGDRKTTAGTVQPKFKWAGTPEGRVAKSIICEAGEAGQNGKAINATIEAIMPWFAGVYEAATGKPLTASMVTGRWQYMNFTAAQRNDGVAITGEKSSEHPANTKSVEFAATWEAVKQADLLVKGEAITQATAIELGTHAAPEKEEEAA